MEDIKGRPQGESRGRGYPQARGKSNLPASMSWKASIQENQFLLLSELNCVGRSPGTGGGTTLKPALNANSSARSSQMAC